jgi:hypothetical protein
LGQKQPGVKALTTATNKINNSKLGQAVTKTSQFLNQEIKFTKPSKPSLPDFYVTPQGISIPKKIYTALNPEQITIISAAQANAPHISAKSWNPPYAINTKVIEFTTTKEVNFARVHLAAKNNMVKEWVMLETDLKGLTPMQIQDKFALPYVPNRISKVYVPANTTIRMGIAGPQDV